MTSKTQSRPISMCDRSRCSIAVHRCYLFFGPNRAPTGASVSRGAGSTRARRARAGSPMHPPGSRDRTPPVVRGRPIRRARGGDTCHDYYPTHPGRSFSRFLPIAAGRARRRDAPWTAEARLARRRRVPRASRAIPRPLPSSTPRR
jgi:hypothetical protein